MFKVLLSLSSTIVKSKTGIEIDIIGIAYATQFSWFLSPNLPFSFGSLCLFTVFALSSKLSVVIYFFIIASQRCKSNLWWENRWCTHVLSKDHQFYFFFAISLCNQIFLLKRFIWLYSRLTFFILAKPIVSIYIGFVWIKSVPITITVNIFEYLNRICVDSCEHENYLAIRTQPNEQISQKKYICKDKNCWS